MANESSSFEENSSMSFLEHLEELRWVFFRALISLLIFFPIGFIFSEDIISFIYSLNGHKGKLKTLIFYEYFLVRLKFSFFLSFFLSFPYILVQFWRFIAPALYKKELFYAKYFLFFSYVLFFLGSCFGFFLIVPTAIAVFNSPDLVPSNILVEDVLGKYINFVIIVTFGCGLASQLPIIILLSYIMGLVTLEKLKKSRPYIIVAIFIASTILTPPDPITQLLMAIPLIFIFELSLLICYFIRDKKENPYIKLFRKASVLKLFFLILVIGTLVMAYIFSPKPETTKQVLLSDRKKLIQSYEDRKKIWQHYKKVGEFKEFIYKEFTRIWEKEKLEEEFKNFLVKDAFNIKLLLENNDLSITFKRQASFPINFQAQWGINIDGREFLLPKSQNYYYDGQQSASDYEYKVYKNLFKTYPYLYSYWQKNKKVKIFAFLKIVDLKDSHISAYWLQELNSPIVVLP